MKINWSPETLEKLQVLIADSPLQYRAYVNVARVRGSADLQAQKLGKSEMDEEALIRGFITAVPRHLRDGITEVLTEHNYDLIYFRPVFDEPNYLPKSAPPGQSVT
jgi:hypothetical protein